MIQKAVRKTKAGEPPAVANDTEEAPVAKADAGVAMDDAASKDVIDFEKETADDFLAEMIPIIRAWMRRLMTESKTPPSTTDGMTRSREAAASSTLVKTLQDLDALSRNREKRGKMNSTLDERQLMERFIRRMDELLSGGKPPSAYKPSADRKPDGE